MVNEILSFAKTLLHDIAEQWMRKNRFQPLRCIFILPRYIFHRRYRLENPARPHCWRVVASLRRKNVAATPPPHEKFNRCAEHDHVWVHRTPICTVVHKTDGIPRSGRHPTPLEQTLCVCIERWRLIPALEANVFAFPTCPTVLIPSGLVNEIEPHISRLLIFSLSMSITRKLSYGIIYSWIRYFKYQRSNVKIIINLVEFHLTLVPRVNRIKFKLDISKKYE